MFLVLSIPKGNGCCTILKETIYSYTINNNKVGNQPANISLITYSVQVVLKYNIKQSTGSFVMERQLLADHICPSFNRTLMGKEKENLPFLLFHPIQSAAIVKWRTAEKL